MGILIVFPHISNSYREDTFGTIVSSISTYFKE